MLVSRLLVSTVFICVFSAFASSVGAFPGQNASQDKTARVGSQLKVKWDSGKLSLDGEAVPLSEVLRAISQETGIEVTGTEGLSNPCVHASNRSGTVPGVT